MYSFLSTLILCWNTIMLMNWRAYSGFIAGSSLHYLSYTLNISFVSFLFAVKISVSSSNDLHIQSHWETLGNLFLFRRPPGMVFQFKCGSPWSLCPITLHRCIDMCLHGCRCNSRFNTEWYCGICGHRSERDEWEPAANWHIRVQDKEKVESGLKHMHQVLFIS